MAKNRYINTKFWDDNYITTLDPIEKLMFLYFLTNPMTDICGIYEIPLRRIAFDTGIDKYMIEKILGRFTADKKIFYIDGFIYIKNFSKNQTSNESVKTGIARSMAIIPALILKEIDLINTACTQPVPSLSQAVPTLSDTLLKPVLELEPKPELKLLAADAAENIKVPEGEIFTGYKLPKESGNNQRQWQCGAAEAIVYLETDEKGASSVFKCFKDNLSFAQHALTDCKEKNQKQTLYFLKIYNQLKKVTKK